MRNFIGASRTILLFTLYHVNEVSSQTALSNDICFDAQSLDSVLNLSTNINGDDTLNMAIVNGDLKDATLDGARSPCGLFESGIGLWYTFTGDGNGIRMDTCLSSSLTASDATDAETEPPTSPTIFVLKGSCGSGAIKGCAGVLSSTEEDHCTLVLSETTPGQKYSIFVERGFSLASEFAFTIHRLPSEAIGSDDIHSNGLCSVAKGPLIFSDNDDGSNSVEVAVNFDNNDDNENSGNKLSPWSSIESCYDNDNTGVGSKGLWYFFNAPVMSIDDDENEEMILEYSIFVCSNEATTTALPSVYSSSGIIGGADGGEYYFCETLNCTQQNVETDDNIFKSSNFEGKCRESTQPYGITLQLEASTTEEQKRYYVLVDNNQDVRTLNVVLSSLSTPVEGGGETTLPRLSNDDCSNAEAIEINTAVVGTLEGAQVEPRTSVLAPIIDPTGVWYTITARENDTDLSVSIAESSVAEAYIIVYRGDCGTFINGAAMVAGFETPTDTVTFNVTEGEVFTIMVYSENATSTFSVGVSSDVDKETNPPVSFCFAGSSHVKVQEQNDDESTYYKTMKELAIGDYVQVSSKKEGKERFSRIYSLGHIHHTVKTEYLQIFSEQVPNKPLEITKDHMLFTVDEGGNEKSIPASNIMVGDQLLLPNGSSSIVTKIQLQQRKGAYAPITEDGTIVVNGVVASCYPTLQPGSEVLQIPFARELLIPTPFSMHTASHWVLGSTRRLLCRLHWNICQKETYTNEGIATWAHDYMLPMAQWFLNHSSGLIIFVAAAAIKLMLSSTRKYKML
mmetsp:Transcript_11443/g.13117  ORF Transcript_11443/g.13117 Transcript_11443/m.13117 type:complete len:792 (+) Transcript_11443:73-2448(+)